MWMVPDMKASGWKTSSTAEDWRGGPMEHPTTASTNRERSTEEESSHGLTEVLSLEISSTIIFMELVSTNGLIDESSMESGKTTRWKVMAPLLGPMGGNMWVNTLMT
jgi:hypothetical protein